MIIVAPHTFNLPQIKAIRTFKDFAEIPTLIKTPVRLSPQEISEHA
ncbi:MAG: hypothetical protein ACW99Q_28945 [Candidatus Kariarchaeaceae archaeon]|jgi:hypothetical protein